MFPSKSCTRGILATVLGLSLFAVGPHRSARAAESALSLPAPAVDEQKQAGPPQTAVLAGGCFWGVQGVFEHVKGVRRVLSGYSGGEQSTAEYEIVGSGTTGHAESVQIVFDPQEISYGEILRVFFSVAHDPTQLNRQGPDWGTQYRSSIFYANEAQRKIAESYIEQLNKAKVFGKPIATRVDGLKRFYPAEDYHQDFLINNPHHPYIVFNDLPKIRNLQRIYPSLYLDSPVTVKAGLAAQAGKN
jgi:peptide-methionine (S)-S-oxide reductase